MRAFSRLLACLRFFSRLPVPSGALAPGQRPPDVTEAAAWVPLAGAIIGLVPACALLAALACGLPAALAAPLAIASLLIATGALHEDGLADCADGFGGGGTRQRKLDIMRDSRIGTFGACAIALSLYVRAIALGLVAARSPWLGAAVIVASASLSRTACLLPLLLLPPARPDGLGRAFGTPTMSRFATAIVVTLGIGCLSVGAGLGGRQFAGAAMLAFGAAGGICGLARRQIGGHTGDVAGAAEQVAAVTFLLVCAAH